MPLWRAVEFSPELDPTAQAGLEAALEGAGLLDAWVTADGSLLDRDTLDAVLVSGPEIDGPRLSELLRPAAEAPEPLRLTLESVGLVADAPAAGSAAVDTRGGFALGPLRGRYAPRSLRNAAMAIRRTRLLRRCGLGSEGSPSSVRPGTTSLPMTL